MLPLEFPTEFNWRGIQVSHLITATIYMAGGRLLDAQPPDDFSFGWAFADPDKPCAKHWNKPGLIGCVGGRGPRHEDQMAAAAQLLRPAARTRWNTGYLYARPDRTFDDDELSRQADVEPYVLGERPLPGAVFGFARKYRRKDTDTPNGKLRLLVAVRSDFGFARTEQLAIAAMITLRNIQPPRPQAA